MNVWTIKPIPNHLPDKATHGRFYVAHLKEKVWLAITPTVDPAIAFYGSLEDAQRAAAHFVDAECRYSVDGIIEVCEREAGGSMTDEWWKRHSLGDLRLASHTPLDYPDAGSW